MMPVASAGSVAAECGHAGPGFCRLLNFLAIQVYRINRIRERDIKNLEQYRRTRRSLSTTHVLPETIEARRFARVGVGGGIGANG